MAEDSAVGAGRSTAIVLFTDLVGSTELRSRLGERAAEELRRKHDRLLGEAVEANSGRVVKGLGDGIMATFTSASDGVCAAVAIQRTIDRFNRAGKSPCLLAVRVGLSAGDVRFDEGDVHGVAVIEAARLCDHAEGGVILAADVVRVLAASEEHRYVSVGPLELKGLPNHVPAVRCEWERVSAASIPLPAALARAGVFSFVGRQAEFEVLVRSWKEAVAGERRVVLLGGEAGIGKTRLSAEIARAVHEDGALVLYGRCDEELGVPYQPFVEALHAYVGAGPADDLAVAVGTLGGELARLLPSLRDRLPDLPAPLETEPTTARYRLLEAVRDVISGMSAFYPVLLVLDDLHWATGPTLVLLRHLLGVGASTRLLVVGTYRDTELVPGDLLSGTLAELWRESGVQRVSLSGLNQDDVVRLVEGAAGHQLDPDDVAFASVVHAETEGNPFFVAEILRHLAETGDLVQHAGRWKTARPLNELGIPQSVREVIGQRLARLRQPTKELLALAAIIGREFDVTVCTAESAKHWRGDPTPMPAWPSWRTISPSPPCSETSTGLSSTPVRRRNELGKASLSKRLPCTTSAAWRRWRFQRPVTRRCAAISSAPSGMSFTGRATPGIGSFSSELPTWLALSTIRPDSRRWCSPSVHREWPRSGRSTPRSWRWPRRRWSAWMSSSRQGAPDSSPSWPSS